MTAQNMNLAFSALKDSPAIVYILDEQLKIMFKQVALDRHINLIKRVFDDIVREQFVDGPQSPLQIVRVGCGNDEEFDACTCPNATPAVTPHTSTEWDRRCQCTPIHKHVPVNVK